MKYLTTLLAAVVLSACASTVPAFAEDTAVCNETVADVQALAAEKGVTFLVTDKAPEGLVIIEGIVGPAPDYIKATVKLVAVLFPGSGVGIIGFVNAENCIIGTVQLPVEIIAEIFKE